MSSADIRYIKIRTSPRSTEAERLDMLAHYGGCCVWCGEDRHEVLEFDHVEDDGARHRREVGGGRSNWGMYPWLRRHGYPRVVQVLCAKCHRAKTRGYMPEHLLAKGKGISAEQAPQPADTPASQKARLLAWPRQHGHQKPPYPFQPTVLSDRCY